MYSTDLQIKAAIKKNAFHRREQKKEGQLVVCSKCSSKNITLDSWAIDSHYFKSENMSASG